MTKRRLSGLPEGIASAVSGRPVAAQANAKLSHLVTCRSELGGSWQQQEVSLIGEQEGPFTRTEGVFSFRGIPSQGELAPAERPYNVIPGRACARD